MRCPVPVLSNSDPIGSGMLSMTLLRSLLMSAARKIAADPRARAKASEVVEKDVQPKLSAAKDELADLVAETNPLEDPKAFVRKLKHRVAEVNRRH